MDRRKISACLECCLLLSQGTSFDELINEHEFNPLIAELGVKIFMFLKSKDISGGIFKHEE